MKLEVKTSRVRAFNLTQGDVATCVSVECRREGERRWTRFLLVPEDDQTLDELEEHAAEAAELYLEQKVWPA